MKKDLKRKSIRKSNVLRPNHKYLHDLMKEDYDKIFDENNRKIEHYDKQYLKYGFDERETWYLDFMFVMWLYEHVMMYKKESSKVISLDFHEFKYNGETKSQREMINILLNKCEYYLTAKDDCYAEIDEIIDIWKLIHNAMWW